jgi:hypothetical protein
LDLLLLFYFYAHGIEYIFRVFDFIIALIELALFVVTVSIEWVKVCIEEVPFGEISMVVNARFKPNLLGKGETMIYTQSDMDGFVAILKDSTTNTTQTIYVSAIDPDAPTLVSQSKFRKPIHRTILYTHKDESFVETVTTAEFEQIPLVVMTPDLIYVGKWNSRE